MSCWAIIPVKAAPGGKSRLAGVLDEDARKALVRAMTGHVVHAAQLARLIDRVAIVGPSRQGLPESVALLADPGKGLNAALHSAVAEAGSLGASRIVIVAGDLPGVAPSDLDRLASTPGNGAAIAPDRHEQGTNALSLPWPAARGFSFAFGPDSFARHRAEAEGLGLEIEVIRSNGLACDIDEPPDLADASALLKRAG